MSISATIRSLAKTLNVGCTAYYDCPNCDRKRKLGVTRFADKVLYQCFSASCGIKGQLSTSPSKETIKKILNKYQPDIEEVFTIPDYFIDGFACEKSVQLALKYDLMEAYKLGVYKTAYDPRLNRQVFYVTDDDGKIVGAMGRALTEGTRKAYIYPGSRRYPYVCSTLYRHEGHTPTKYSMEHDPIHGRNTREGTSSTGSNGQDLHGEIFYESTAVIVEDIFSAIKCYTCGYTGVALQGTSLAVEYLHIFSKYNTVIIALDKDASIKSLELKKLLQLYVENVKIVLLERDIKDMTRTEVKELLS